MTDATKVRAGRPSGRRKTANRFARLAGGDVPADPTPQSPTPAEDDGLIGAMSAATTGDVLHVVQIPVAEIAPHPFNDPSRSRPQPGDTKWDELLNGVRANGVRLPVLAVPRDAFLAARPTATQNLPVGARYVLVYGHRRRAAALEAGRDTIPAVLDETVMADDGDLDAMAAENLGRQDLSELAEAELFARYSGLGLSQRAIATRLGIDQATVSRRLALLLLAPDLRDVVDAGHLPSADAAALAGLLPYGPPRRWQKSKDPDQHTEQRRHEQLHALELIYERGMLAPRAAELVIAERNARVQAAQWNLPIVDDPRAELGERFYEHRITDYDPTLDIIAAIDPGLGTLVLYARPLPCNAGTDGHNHVDPQDAGTELADILVPRPAHPREPASEDSEPNDPFDNEAAASEKHRAAEIAAAMTAAREHRRQACSALISHHQISNADLLRVLVGQYMSGVAARSATTAVSALLRDWDAETTAGSGDKARMRHAWHRAVAAAELHTTELKDRTWDEAAIAHLTMLIERVGYQPTPWEREQLDEPTTR